MDSNIESTYITTATPTKVIKTLLYVISPPHIFITDITIAIITAMAQITYDLPFSAPKRYISGNEIACIIGIKNSGNISALTYCIVIGA